MMHKALQEIRLELCPQVNCMATQTDDTVDTLTDPIDKYQPLPFEECGTNTLNHEFDIEAKVIQNETAQDESTESAAQNTVIIDKCLASKNEAPMQTEESVAIDLGQIVELVATVSSLQAELMACRQESLDQTASLHDKYGKMLQAAFDEIEKLKTYIEFLNQGG